MSCSSGTMVIIAFTFAFTRWICCRCACITSRDESFLVRIASTISTARMKQISFPGLGVAVFGSVAVAVGPRAPEKAVPVPSLRASRRVMLLFTIPLWSRRGVIAGGQVSVSWSGLPDNVLLSWQPAWIVRGSRDRPEAACKWYPHQRRWDEPYSVFCSKGRGNHDGGRSARTSRHCAGPVLRGRSACRYHLRRRHLWSEGRWNDERYPCAAESHR